ncbi:dehydratase [Nocardia pseudobrasiliensis]|uniref:Dehydratase n=2 Tax=Nocardia pseudobrasiliensis TaxID=45979 RepID=A0A370HYD9_9NOCA|nr:dehydratase [Nocardia pseudobrasiliensis]
MKPTISLFAWLAAAAPIALAATWCPAAPAGAVPQGTTTVNFLCQGTVFGISQKTTMTMQVVGDAPGSAAPGSAVTITLASTQQTVPASSNGFTVNNIRNLKLVMPDPTNSSVTSVTLSGGTVAGTVTASGGTIALNVPGPIAGGSNFTLPAETINVTAGASGSITTTLSGTSYSSPGLTLTSNVQGPFGPLDVPVSCYPKPAPTFTTTTIGAQPGARY